MRRPATCNRGLWLKLQKRSQASRAAAARGEQQRVTGVVSKRLAPEGASSVVDCAASGQLPESSRPPSAPDVSGGVLLLPDESPALPVDAPLAVLAVALGPEGQAEDAKGKPKRQVVLLASVFEGRQPVLMFSYTVACGAEQRPMDRTVLADINGPKLYYSHTDAVHEYNAVINTLRQGGLYRIRSDSPRWSLLWSSHPPPEVLRALRPAQRTNHFPGSWNLGHKDKLWRNISLMQRRFGREFTITPQGYNLPKSAVAWEAARVRQPDALWIWKPCSQSCGRGIKVLSSQLSREDARDLGRKRGIIQRYVPNPLLIEGYKFDLRVYVVVLSYNPLKVYINDEGLVRLATEKFSTDPSTLGSRTMHLTNYSVNKLCSAFVQNQDGRMSSVNEEGEVAEKDEKEEKDDGRPASKWSFKELQKHFQLHRLDYDATFNRIGDLVIKTLIAAEQPMQQQWSTSLETGDEGWVSRRGGAHPASCFEMYGFDVLIDADLKPWLLEVNICPSLSSGSPLDKRIKTKLVADTLTLVGIRPPPSIWRSSGVKRSCWDMAGITEPEAEKTPAQRGSAAESAKGASRLASCSPADAVAQFDETAWELVLDSHEEDMRAGGLARIFPTEQSGQYAQFMGEESYENLVLRKWHEAGGGELFRPGAHLQLPPWVPRKVCFNRT